MKFSSSLAALLVLALIVGCSTLGADEAPMTPNPSSSPEPTPTPAWETFTSDRYGYSVAYPAEWEVREQVGEVTLGGLRPRHPGTDNFGTPDAHRLDLRDGVVMVTARDLVEGESLADFTEEADDATTCGPPFGYDSVTLGGEPAEFRKFECSTTFWVQITAIHDSRAYLVWLISTTPPKADRRPVNHQFLESFAFSD